MKTRFGDIELITRSPTGPARATPLLFIHGAYTGAWCWDEHFLPFFAEAGYVAHALSLRGHGRSAGRQHLDSLGIADYVADAVAVAEGLGGAPALIGHSMGGMVVQKYLERAEAPAAALLAAVPPQGLWSSALGLAFSKPGLMRELNALLSGGRVALESLREALFAQPVGSDELLRYFRLMQPESHRALWDMTLFDLPQPHRMHRPPLLVLGGEHDHLIPASQVALTARTYGVQAEIIPGMGHGLMLERDWERVARRLLAWFDALDL